jgi:hypothetical protein
MTVEDYRGRWKEADCAIHGEVVEPILLGAVKL